MRLDDMPESGNVEDRRGDGGGFGGHIRARRVHPAQGTQRVQADERASAVLQQYLTRIDDDRLKRTFAAAIALRSSSLKSSTAPACRARLRIRT